MLFSTFSKIIYMKELLFTLIISMMAISVQATDSKPSPKPVPKHKVVKKVPAKSTLENCHTTYYQVSGQCTTYSSSYTFCCFTCDPATAMLISYNAAYNEAMMVATFISQLEEIAPC